jgi:hypothetical protein
MMVHVPARAAHESHAPAHSDSQQTPSAQKPETQSEGAAHVEAFFERHAPFPSHILDPEHVSSSELTTGVHVPGEAEPPHVWHGSAHSALQQYPSRQRPEAHSPSFPQTVPSNARVETMRPAIDMVRGGLLGGVFSAWPYATRRVPSPFEATTGAVSFRTLVPMGKPLESATLAALVTQLP